MPLVDTQKPKSPMTVWWLACWLVGFCLWLAVLQLAFTWSVEVLTSSLVRSFTVLGLLLSAIDGVSYVRGDEPHRSLVRSPHHDEQQQVVEQDGQHGVVVLNQMQPPKKPDGNGGGNRGTSALHAIFFIAPRTLGDVALTLFWKGIARALGRGGHDTPPLRDDYPTGQYVRSATSRLRRLWS